MARDTRKTVVADPSKEFFISMLVRDIGLEDAVADLADNCVEGAMRVRKNRSFRGFEIRIAVDKSHFTIADNCGGIPVDLARNYAFRFGRPDEYEGLKHGWGRFGVGMKRALFKIGGRMTIVSQSPTSYFNLHIDVDKWKKKPRDWTFEFADIPKEHMRVPLPKCWTEIVVTDLQDGVGEEFGLANFVSRLSTRIASRLEQPIMSGLRVFVNGERLTAERPHLLRSKTIRPAYWHTSFGKAAKRLSVRMYAGITKPHAKNPERAGWYVYCNERVILAADQTATTGWGSGRGSGVPKYHNQYDMLRGYVFFDADDPSLLPWTTTKTNVDESSGAWMTVRQQMVEAMGPVIRFLNELDREKNEREDTTLETALDRAVSVALSRITTESAFTFPKTAGTTKNPLQRIAFKRPRAKIDRIKSEVDLSSNEQVGEHAFDYFWNREMR